MVLVALVAGGAAGCIGGGLYLVAAVFGGCGSVMTMGGGGFVGG